MYKIIFWTFFVFLHLSLQAQTISIKEARTKAEGSTVTVEGVVTNGAELGVIRYIQDSVAGIGVYDASLKDVKRGDFIRVTGVLKSWNNLLEISPVTQFIVLDSNHALPSAINKPVQEVFSEAYEGMLVTLSDVEFTTQGTFSGNTNYIIRQNGFTAQVRIDNHTSIPGTGIPAGKTHITGIMSQYQNNYQLLPRDLGDLGFLNSPLTLLDMDTSSLTFFFKTEEPATGYVEYGYTQKLELGSVASQPGQTKHQITIPSLNPATFYYVRAKAIRSSGDTLYTGLGYYSTASSSTGKIIAYFNNPVDNSYASDEKAFYLRQSIDDTLVSYIQRAKYSIDMAMYNFINQGLNASITQALNNAHERGVQIRIIVDGSTSSTAVKDLNGQIPVLKSPTGQNYKIMHNKFIVFDALSSDPAKPIVWTGSTNLTPDQINYDPNNVIIIQDQALAKAYTMEFNEMWGGSGAFPNTLKSRFGPYKTDNTPHHFKIGGNWVECYFSPSDNVNSHIIDAIRSADASIYFATYVFTRTSIAYPMLDKYNEGVYVAGIFGDVSSGNDPAYNVLSPVLKQNIKVYNQNYIFHHKYAIIDYGRTYEDWDPLVITGSHNWSSSADKSNDENTLIIHSKSLTSIYFQEWAQRFKDLGGTVYVSRPPRISENENAFSLRGFYKDHYLKIWLETDRNVQLISLAAYDTQGKQLLEKYVNNHESHFFSTLYLDRAPEIIFLMVRTQDGVQTLKLIKSQ